MQSMDVPCSSDIREAMSAVKIAVAISLSKESNMRNIEIGKSLGVSGAAVTKYLSGNYSRKTARLVSYVIEKRMERGVMRSVLSDLDAEKTEAEVERAAALLLLGKRLSSRLKE